MAQSPAPEVTVTLESVSSHSTTLIDQIESILTSPSAFTTSTPTALFPFLEQLQYEDQDDEGQERIVRVVKWCEQLDDAVTAANARQVITMYLEEVRSWPEWTYSTTAEAVGKRKERVEEIKRGLAELPIEWLKSRVTGMSPYFKAGLLMSRVAETGRRVTSSSVFNDTHHFLVITAIINSLGTIANLYSPVSHIRYLVEVLFNYLRLEIIPVNSLSSTKPSSKRNSLYRSPCIVHRSRALVG